MGGRQSVPRRAQAGVEGSLTLKALFEPEHVAVIGASRTPTKHSHRVVTGLLSHGFPGRISLINPSGGDIAGLPCVDSIGDVAGHVDCAMLAIPAERIVEAVRDCAAAGVSTVIVAAVGFAEMGTDEGRRRQDEILSIARMHNLRLFGPNTNGIFNASHHFSFGSNTSHGEPMEPGVISVVSHSGALFNHFARRLRQLGTGLSKFAPVGNEVDITMLDVLEYYIDDPFTRVIGMIVEGIADGPRFRSLVERAAEASKPIVAFKLGRSASGAKSSLAHSSRLAGDARAYDALFARYRIASVPTVEALAGACSVLAGRTPQTVLGDQRLVCIANSGAASAMLADLAETYGIPLAADENREWPEPVLRALASMPALTPIRNPIDTGNFGGKRLLDHALGAIADGGLTGPTLAFLHTVLLPNKVEYEARAIIKRRDRTGSPAIVVTPGGLEDVFMELYAANGIPVFRDTLTAFESLRAHYSTLPGPAPRATPQSGRASDGIGQAGAKLRLAAANRREDFLPELESSEILRDIGVSVVQSRTVTTGAEARDAAAACGYPVVIKALAAGVAHKDDLGFVVTSIADASSLQHAYENLEGRVLAAGYRREDVTFILQPMLASKAEFLAGVSRQDGLGHFLVAGLGGVYAEALDVVTLIPIPADAATIRSTLQATRLGTLISKIGGSAETLWDSITGVLHALSLLIEEHGDVIESIDINPLLITGKGCVAVDALVVLRKLQEANV